MAFFLVMWLVTAVSKDQRAAIFDYFKNPSMEPGKSAKPAPGQMGPGGASTSPINLQAAWTRCARRSLPSARSVRPRRRSADAQTPQQAAGAQAAATEEQKKIEQLTLQAQQEAEHKKLESLMEELQRGGRQEPGARALQGSAAARHHPGRAAHPDRRRAEPPDVRCRQRAAARLHRSDPARARAVSRDGAEPHQHHRSHRHHGRIPATAATRTGSCPPIAPMPRAARSIAAACPMTRSRASWDCPPQCCSTSTNPHNPINRRISIIVMTKQAEEEALKTDAAAAEVTPDTPAAPATAPADTPAAAPAASAAAPPATDSPLPAAAQPRRPGRAACAPRSSRPPLLPGRRERLLARAPRTRPPGSTSASRPPARRASPRRNPSCASSIMPSKLQLSSISSLGW